MRTWFIIPFSLLLYTDVCGMFKTWNLFSNLVIKRICFEWDLSLVGSLSCEFTRRTRLSARSSVSRSWTPICGYAAVWYVSTFSDHLIHVMISVIDCILIVLYVFCVFILWIGLVLESDITVIVIIITTFRLLLPRHLLVTRPGRQQSSGVR
jgi:hypothetical protein